LAKNYDKYKILSFYTATIEIFWHYPLSFAAYKKNIKMATLCYSNVFTNLGELVKLAILSQNRITFRIDPAQ
jgi:hypothetical protein